MVIPKLEYNKSKFKNYNNICSEICFTSYLPNIYKEKMLVKINNEHNFSINKNSTLSLVQNVI